MILPAGILTGICLGGSVALLQVKELPTENKWVQKAYGNRHRAAVISTALSIAVGIFTGPVAGVISEMINYPAALYKCRLVEKHKQSKYTLPDRTFKDASMYLPVKPSRFQLQMAFS